MSGGSRAAGRTESSSAAKSGAPGGETTSLLLFRLGRRAFAMDVRAIAEVALQGQVTRVPMAPDHILGVTSLRGRLVTVVSLEQMLGGEGMLPVDSSATLPRLVVLRDGDYELAVVAHGITGLVERTSTTVVQPAGRPDFVREEFTGEDGPVELLDAGRLLAAAARLAGTGLEEGKG